MSRMATYESTALDHEGRLQPTPVDAAGDRPRFALAASEVTALHLRLIHDERRADNHTVVSIRSSIERRRSRMNGSHLSQCRSTLVVLPLSFAPSFSHLLSLGVRSPLHPKIPIAKFKDQDVYSRSALKEVSNCVTTTTMTMMMMLAIVANLFSFLFSLADRHTIVAHTRQVVTAWKTNQGS